VLLHGPAGSGKTALAATLAMASEFPFIKLISPESMVGFSESAKMGHIGRVFEDAYKSPLSVVFVDCIERILDWVPIGPRFSNAVLQTLLVLFKKPPPKGNKLLILCTTTNRAVLEQMDMADVFNAELYVGNITSLDVVARVVRDLGVFSASELGRAIKMLEDAGVGGNIAVGVKKLMMICEMARQDVDKVEKFVDAVVGGGTLDERQY
jgi:vesicle-fusing ATPase